MKSDSTQRHRVPLLSHAQYLRALLGVILATCACMLALTPAPAFAADTGVISVATVDDSPYLDGEKDLIDITKETQRVADIYDGGASGPLDRIHNRPFKIHVELSGLNNQGTGINKTLEVKLAQGVKWVTDTNAVLAENLDTTKGTKGIDKVNLSKLVNKFDLAGGTRIYYLQDGVRSISFDLFYTVDPIFISKTGTVINDPITITVKEGGTPVGTAKLNGLTNSVDFGHSEGNPKWDGTFNFNRAIGETSFIFGQHMRYQPPRFGGLAFSDEVFATITVSDPRAKIVEGEEVNYVLDSTDADQGIYKVKALANPWKKLLLGRGVFQINLPEDAEFVAGDKITVTCHFEIKGYDVDGKPYSKTCPDGIYTVTAAAPTHQLFINSNDLNKPVKDETRTIHISNGEGILSNFWFSSSSTEKGKTVEQYFDPAAHIYAVEVINPAGTDNPVGMTFNVSWIPVSVKTKAP